MNIDELATNVARDIGAVRQRSCKRADGVEYHFEQSELEQFAKELIAEYEKTVNSELYPRPDPRVAELEADRDDCLALAKLNMAKFLELEQQIAALLVAIKAKDAALNLWKVASDNAEESELDDMACYCITMPLFCDAYEATEALALSPSTELLEARDRVRDAKLIRQVNLVINKKGYFTDYIYPEQLKQVAADRESGEWQPLLDGD